MQLGISEDEEKVVEPSADAFRHYSVESLQSKRRSDPADKAAVGVKSLSEVFSVRRYFVCVELLVILAKNKQKIFCLVV